ncbi:MAG TPA: SRPBCC family protein [Jatrophihabitans sp.]|jgi:uncharacterized protein YndB with AHSA1/START domain
MSTLSTHIKASPSEVFAVLADGWTYSNWVVGTSHIRAVEDQWPAPGSTLHHAVGAWPLITRDKTVVQSVTPEREIVLRARGSQLGEAVVTIELRDDADGCAVTMHETPISGLGRWLHNPVNEALLTKRNQESLRRLRATVERRTEA